MLNLPITEEERKILITKLADNKFDPRLDDLVNRLVLLPPNNN